MSTEADKYTDTPGGSTAPGRPIAQQASGPRAGLGVPADSGFPSLAIPCEAKANGAKQWQVTLSHENDEEDGHPCLLLKANVENRGAVGINGIVQFGIYFSVAGRDASPRLLTTARIRLRAGERIDGVPLIQFPYPRDAEGKRVNEKGHASGDMPNVTVRIAVDEVGRYQPTLPPELHAFAAWVDRHYERRADDGDATQTFAYQRTDGGSKYQRV